MGPNRPSQTQTLSKYISYILVKGEGKRFLHGDLVCTYTLPEYIFGIYVDGLYIISVKLNF